MLSNLVPTARKVHSNSFITARKRSLGQGNIFTLIFLHCHSVHSGGAPGQVHPPRDPIDPPGTRHTPGPGTPLTPRTRYTPQTRYPLLGPGTPPETLGQGTPLGTVHAGRYGQQAGGTHPTGIHSCLISCCFQRDFLHKYKSISNSEK